MMNVRLQIGVKAESLLQKQNGTDPDRADGSIPGEEQPQKSYFSPPHTYTTCYGLPYQDHNYVAPPPPTPPASPPPPPAPKINGHIDIEDVSSNTEVTTTVVPPEETIYTPDDSITRCVCEFEHDDGYMICCDKCSVWQHVDCMGVDRNNIPDKYLCEKCEPREVDKKRAKELQIKKREELAAILYAIDSSATETGDETIGITPERERTKKSKGKKKKEREKATKANQKKNKKLKKDKKQKDKISTPSQKIKKKSRALSSNQQVNKQPITTPEPAPEKKVPTPQTTPPAVVPTSPVGTEVTPPAAPGKRASRRGSLKSPKSPAKTANKSPIAKPLTPKSPAKSPVAKSPVKSPLRSPVKSPAKSPVKSPAKLPSTLNLSEDALDPWDNRLPDGYEEAKNNQYTPDIERLLSTKKLNGLHADSGESKPCTRLLDQLCKVAQVHASCKGIETTEDVEADRVMIEYIGKVMLREQYDKDNIFFRRLQPFVLFYSDFENLDLCVNAESYGNDARYVRRSCTPNARVQHVVENGKVLFFIYSQKDISKGAEVTIPFDFDYHESNYDVQCACSRPTCPVSKRHKKEEKTGKKKRSSRLSQREKKTSISVDPAEESNSNVSVGNSKPATAASVVTSTSTTSPTTSPTATGPSNSTAGPPPKRRRITPLNMNAANKHHESTSETMTRRRSATLREEEKIAEEAKTAPPTPMSPGPTSACLLSDGEEDPAAAEKRRKMTREERKMEAIMKAFEKLEKREERRKEALARLEHAKKTDKNDKDVKEGKDSVPDQLEKKEDSKPEAVAPPPAEQKPKAKVKKKGKHGMPSRRCSRVNSNASGNSSSAEPPSSTDEGSNQVAPPTPASAPPGGCDTSMNSVSSTPLTPGSAQQGKAFRFPKTKKHLMNEWLSEKAQDLQKPLTIKTEPLDVNTADSGDKNTEFIKCVPSPHATPLSHLRRSSFSGTYTPKSFNSPAPSQLDCNLGSAKKRWLRQAMFESTSSQPGTQQSPSGSMSPIPNGGMSPNPNSCTNSPGASPQVGHNVADFVTPLKKRRLARESISMDTPPYPPTPSTPTPTGSELPLSEGDKHEALDNVRVKVEDGGTRLMNGFKPHLSPITPATPAERLFDINHLHEDRRMLYSEKQESMESSVSELLLAPSCSSLTRERHESGRSDCRSDYRSEIDTDTEDSRMEEVFRQNNGGDGLSVPHGFEMLHKLALKAEQQRQEGISLRMSSARSEGDVFEEPTKSEPDYKIELKPDLKPLPSSTASFHPSLVGLGPGAEDERMERENSMERTESMDRTESMEKESDSFSEDNVVCQAAQPEEKQLQVESSSSPLSALTRSSTVSRAESKSHNDSGLNVGAGSSHDGAASFFPSSEQCEHVTDSGGPTDLGHRDNVTSPESKLLRPHVAGDHPNVDNSERSHCNSEPRVQEAPSAAAALQPAPQRDVHIDEVASSSESARGSRDCTGSCDGSSEAMVSGSAPDNCAEPTVTSHLEARAPHLSVLPSQSDALVASGSKDEVEGMPSINQARHLESPDQGQVSSDGDPAVVQNVEEGEVTSQAGEDVVAICEGDGDEQASSESSTGEHSVGSSNKDIGSSDKRRDSLVEMQVSCSSDPPVPGPADQPEPGTSSSVSASHSTMDEEYELEEGECVSDSEEVTSMDVSDHSAVGHAPSEVSSSRAEARHEREEDMEVDLPDQSSVDRGHSSEPCSSARPSQASGSLPDMASTTSCSEGEGTVHQEPHSATRSPAFLRTQSDVAEETIDSTSGSIGPSPGEPDPSGSAPSEGIGVTGDVSSSSTPLHPSLGCGAVRERTNSSSKDEEPSPSTSSPRSQVVRSLRTRSLSADHEAHSLTLRTQGGSLPCSSNTERPSEGVSTASDSNQSVSAAGNCSISSSTSVSLPSAGISTSSLPSSSSVVALSSTSPTGTAAAAPSSSGGLCSIPVLLPPTRKRVSLLEYRKRMKQKGRDGAPSSSLFSLSYSSSSSSSTSSSTSSSPLPSPGSSSTPRPAARDPRGYSMSPKDLNIETPPTLATLPLFDKYSNPADRQLHKGGPNSTSREDEDPETRWNTAATSVERVREQTLSLTERLRREFGVEAAESDAEEDERTKERRRLAGVVGGPSSPPPPPPPAGKPPPPPPATKTATHNVGEGGQLMYGGSQGMGHLPPPPPPPHHGGPAAGRNVQPPPPPPPPAPHPAMMGAPPLGMAPTSHGQPGPPPHQQAQQAPQQQAPQPAPSNMRNLMAIPSYTTKHFNKRSGGPAGGSSNPGGPGYPYQHGPHGGPPPLGQTYPPPSSTSQFNNLPPQSAPPYPRAGGGPGYGPHNHHPPGPAHPHQHPHQHPPPPPPPPPPAAQGASSTAPYNSAPYSAPHAQYSTAGPPPPPPPPPRSFAPSYGQQPPPGNIKILRDYQHPKQH